MHARVLLLASAVFGLASSALTQPIASPWPGMQALMERLTSVDPAKATPAACDDQVAKAAQLNAPDLLYGASVCSAAKRPVDASFLMTAGQIRAVADLLFHEGVLRQSTSRDQLLRRLDAWSPVYGPDYDPGWRTRRRPDGAAYQTTIAEMKAARRKQLADAAALYSDPAYYALHRRFQALQARNPRVFIEGTPDERLSKKLMRQMDERAVALGLAEPGAAERRDDPSRPPSRFAPARPATDETPGDASDTVALRCAALAERMTIAQDSRIVGLLVTRSAEWGTIWRADLAAKNRQTERMTCTQTSTSMQPLKLGDQDSLPPLPPPPAAAN